MKKIIFAVTVITAALAFAAAQSTGSVEKHNSPKPLQFVQGIFIGSDARALAEEKNKITTTLGNSATIDFASTSVGEVLSSAITVTGAQAGDPCFVGVPAAAGALAADFTCVVSAADAVKVKFSPHSVQNGTSAALNGASPSVITVTSITASSKCTASAVGTTAGEAIDVSLSGTTLTLTGPNSSTSTVNYNCVAPVDPASGTYFVRVISSQ